MTSASSCADESASPPARRPEGIFRVCKVWHSDEILTRIGQMCGGKLKKMRARIVRIHAKHVIPLQ